MKSMVDGNPVRFNVAFLIWCGFFLALSGAGLVILASLDRLPSPPITATDCIDEKFRFLHETPIRHPNLLAVGSSVTWRNLDFSFFEEYYGDEVQPLNAAPCFLYINQTAYLTDFLLDNMPGVKTVLSIVSMRDFSKCSSSPTAFFDPEDARGYVFEGQSGWHLYYKNFRPAAFVRDVISLPGRRSGETSYGSLVMDKYGSGPVTLASPEIRENFEFDRSCLTHLKSMSDSLARRGITFVVVLLPLMPAWRDAYDPGGDRDAEFRSAVAEQLASTRTVLIDPQKGLKLKNENFTDHAHLQWSSVPLLMQYLIAQLERTQLSFVGERKDLAAPDRTKW
jgi:hypothetical protein